MLIAIACWLPWPAVWAQHAPQVVVSISPLHHLATAVMQGVSEPTLLLRPGASPHQFSLRPSQMRQLRTADMIVWLGPSLELPLKKVLERARSRSRIVTVEKLTGLKILEIRSDFSPQSPAHHRHDHDHDPHGIDPHLWLDPENALVIVTRLTAALSRIDPDHADQYQTNQQVLSAKLKALGNRLHAQAIRLRDIPFLVYHDAFQYLESFLGVSALGAVNTGALELLSAKSIAALRRTIQQHRISCILVETGTPARAITPLFGRTAPRIARMDPLGLTVAAGPDAYIEMMKKNMAAFATCAGP